MPLSRQGLVLLLQRCRLGLRLLDSLRELIGFGHENGVLPTTSLRPERNS